MYLKNQRKTLILNYFQSSICGRTFKDVNIAQLKHQGIKLFISDLDNTLVSRYIKLPNKELFLFIHKIQEAKIEFVLMFNNIKSRVLLLVRKVNIKEWYSNARKTFKFIIKKILNNRNYVSLGIIIIMGNQIIFDILLANRLKCESILVQFLVSTNYKISSLNMFLKKSIYQNLVKKNILHQEEYLQNKLGNSFELL